MMYGILDTADNCWLGDDSGPRLFDDLLHARIASQLWEAQTLGTDLGGRFKAVEFTGGNLRKRDELPIKREALRALRGIEGRIQ